MKRALLCALCAVSMGVAALAQARRAPDWTTAGFDAQRTSWVRSDPFISIESLPKFRFLWKLKVDNESRFGNSLTSPVALGNLMSFRGFKSLLFVSGSSNNVYAIDYDFGTMFWRTHHNYTAGAREYAGSPTCPGGMTLPVTRATALAPPTALAFFGFARPPRPAKGEVGEPGKGAPQLAEIAARQVGLASRGRSDAPPPAPAAAPAGRAGAAPPPARGTAPGGPGPDFVLTVASDGLLRALIPDTGDLAMAPAPFLPPNATATGLIWTDGFVYAATSNACGGAPQAVWAMDFSAPGKPVTSWDAEGASISGLAVGPDGTVYATTGSGPSPYANSIVALDRGTLALRDWLRQDAPFMLPPAVFSEGDRTYLAAASASGVYVLDAGSLGGADHRTPLAVASESGARYGGGVATWRDAAGTRWVLADANGAIAAFKVGSSAGRPAVERVWTSRAMPSPRAPIVVNDVVFALASGSAGSSAVLYALDPATGKELWTSGSTMTAPASAGLSAGTGQVHVVTADNTVWSFGIPLAIE